MGLHESQLPGPEMNLRELIHKMRNSVAHFCVQVESASDAHLVDWIVFRESQEDGEVYASFSAPELLPFLKYYATLLLDNMARRRAPMLTYWICKGIYTMLILDCSSRTQALHTLSAGFGCSPEKLKKCCFRSILKVSTSLILASWLMHLSI